METLFLKGWYYSPPYRIALKIKEMGIFCASALSCKTITADYVQKKFLEVEFNTYLSQIKMKTSQVLIKHLFYDQTCSSYF